MNKRQVKKLAKNAKANMTPYRKVYGGTGSKKLERRRRAFFRFGRGGAWWDRQQRDRRRFGARFGRRVANDEASLLALLLDLSSYLEDLAVAEEAAGV